MSEQAEQGRLADADKNLAWDGLDRVLNQRGAAIPRDPGPGDPSAAVVAELIELHSEGTRLAAESYARAYWGPDRFDEMIDDEGLPPDAA